MKPFVTRSDWGVESDLTQSSTQWWLVSTSPPGDTNDAEQFDERSDARCTWSSQARLGLKPCACATFADGKLSKVHMPSSARALFGSAAASTSAAALAMRT